MTDDSTCKVISIEMLKIKMLDEIVRTMSDVRHVHGLTKTLISLTSLNSRGCRYLIKGRVLKVVKDNKLLLKVK